MTRHFAIGDTCRDCWGQEQAMCSTCKGTGKQPAAKPTYEQLLALVEAYEARDKAEEAIKALSTAKIDVLYELPEEQAREEYKNLDALHTTALGDAARARIALAAARKAAGR